eukprot:TRINITY_DN67629_c0_g1_i1.p1 TRINITY_DN67629_c0_g1~~TRINITY_DN67629_c0_g1_i1.p1  ORF type:complete len:179 (-),score=17.12 TRINITY_DN67629_c0_g1_i1:72-557(-)
MPASGSTLVSLAVFLLITINLYSVQAFDVPALQRSYQLSRANPKSPRASQHVQRDTLVSAKATSDLAMRVKHLEILAAKQLKQISKLHGELLGGSLPPAKATPEVVPGLPPKIGMLSGRLTALDLNIQDRISVTRDLRNRTDAALAKALTEDVPPRCTEGP